MCSANFMELYEILLGIFHLTAVTEERSGLAAVSTVRNIHEKCMAI